METWLLLVGLFAKFVTSACVPDFAESLLSNPTVLQHPAVVAAFERVGKSLSSLYINTTRDGLSFAVVGFSRLFE